ncbi:MAG: DUF3817 domain-containing protein [Bacteroidetes bacterium]|nr:MAG: DUF3817 domain-containing protein [Bacteroidota bacterium]
MGKLKFLNALRRVGTAEGISYLLLLFVAMPLKYLANIPQPVSVIGMAHGVLFVLYVAGLYYAWQAYKLPFKQAALGMVCSMLPFGPFVFDKTLVKMTKA